MKLFSLITTVVYDFLLLVLLFFLSPKWFFQRFRQKGERDRFLDRLLGRAKGLDRGHGRRLWFHAVSVGEVHALEPLFSEYSKLYPNKEIVVSTITKTGLKAARASLKGAVHYCILPFDFSWAMARFTERVHPEILILLEGDYWRNMILSVKKRGGIVLVASAKLSSRSLSLYGKAPFFFRPLFRSIDYFCAQNEEMARRISKLGVDEKRVSVAGNLKLDSPPPPLSFLEKEALRSSFRMGSNDRMVILGSTHPKEELLLLKALLPPLKEMSSLKIVLFPRHPIRKKEIEKELREHYIPYTLFPSCLSSFSKVVLVSQMGLLSRAYFLASIAIVGGSFVPKIGGHNIFEPVQCGVPVLFGPYMDAQEEFVELIVSSGAGKQLPLEQIGGATHSLLCDYATLEKMRKQGEALHRRLKGVTKRHLAAFAPFQPKN